MCLGTDCRHDDMDRRAFLAGSTAALAGLAASRAPRPRTGRRKHRRRGSWTTPPSVMAR